MQKRKTIEIANLVRLVRGKRVMLDFDLASLYRVETKQLNRAVKRNLERFPEDFMFQLTIQEVRDLRCQIGTFEAGVRGQHSKYLSYAFTQEGIAMLSSVLGSKEAISVNIGIMRAFVAMRDMISTHAEFSRKLEQLEYRLGQHDEEIAGLFETIKQLMKIPEPKKKARIGF